MFSNGRSERADLLVASTAPIQRAWPARTRYSRSIPGYYIWRGAPKSPIRGKRPRDCFPYFLPSFSPTSAVVGYPFRR